MIPREKRRAASASRTADTENLHTDVMRFMAILGLCLAAIFALVQSVPVRSTDVAPVRPPDPERLEAALERERLNQLQKEINRLTEEILETRRQNDTAARALQVTRMQLNAAADQAGQVRRERDRMASQVRDLAEQLQRKHSDLDAIQRRLQQKSALLAALKQGSAEDHKKSDRVQAAPEPPRSEPRPERSRKPIGEVKPLAPESTRKGFTLRFASREVLEHLVSTQVVKLYAMMNRQAWRLSLRAGRPAFAADAFPRHYHEMTPDTVPPGYARALTLVSEAGQGGGLTWGVRLPSGTEQAIADLTRHAQGGDLVIGADGRVHLNETVTTGLGRAR